MLTPTINAVEFVLNALNRGRQHKNAKSFNQRQFDFK